MTMAITNHSSPPQSPSTKTVMRDDKKEVGFFVRVMIKGRVQGVFYRNWTVGVCNPIGVKRLVEEQKGWFCGGSILW
uniref:Acylphosphatase n=1 Tax=Populus trichocarpa TaxID=3694 RepID=A0A3N7F2L1_POPTR